jgi:hypothetical protein
MEENQNYSYHYGMSYIPLGNSQTTLYIEYEKLSWEKQEQAPLLHPRVRSQFSSSCVYKQLVTIQSIRRMGSKHGQFERINMPTGQSSLSKYEFVFLHQYIIFIPWNACLTYTPIQCMQFHVCNYR